MPPALASALPDALPSLWREVSVRYAEPHRHYHGLEHLRELDTWFAAVADGPGWEQPSEIALAILLHDAVYEPGQSDNEERSAQLVPGVLARDLRGEDAGDRIGGARVAALIRLTARHGEPMDDIAEDADAAHFLDADMAVLGSDPERFARYDRDVRAEFADHVPGPAYEWGRRRFLRSLLESGIFISTYFRERLEQRARRNVEAALRV